MRTLNLEELYHKLDSKATDVEYADKQFYLNKLIQFWNFLEGQPRMSQIFTQIEKEYQSIGDRMPALTKRDSGIELDKVLDDMDTSEKQGAFGYFVIKQVKKFERWEEPYNISMQIFQSDTSYEDSKDKFNEFIFIPFADLLKEILEESESNNLNDYFSHKEIEQSKEKIDNVIEELDKLSLGQEVIYEELQELKEQLTVLNKKNFLQLLKGKLYDIALVKGTETAVNFIFQSLTGEDLKLLD